MRRSAAQTGQWPAVALALFLLPTAAATQPCRLPESYVVILERGNAGFTDVDGPGCGLGYWRPLKLDAGVLATLDGDAACLIRLGPDEVDVKKIPADGIGIAPFEDGATIAYQGSGNSYPDPVTVNFTRWDGEDYPTSLTMPRDAEYWSVLDRGQFAFANDSRLQVWDYTKGRQTANISLASLGLGPEAQLVDVAGDRALFRSQKALFTAYDVVSISGLMLVQHWRSMALSGGAGLAGDMTWKAEGGKLWEWRESSKWVKVGNFSSPWMDYDGQFVANLEDLPWKCSNAWPQEPPLAPGSNALAVLGILLAAAGFRGTQRRT